MKRVLRIVLVVALILGIRYFNDSDRRPTTPRSAPASAETSASVAEASSTTGRDRIRRAYRDRESKVWVEADGIVEAILRDDNEGSRHQKFIVELGDHTVLISHNIDLAPRVPLERGDRVVFRGRYEWNDRGGVVHWTHHDPQGRLPGGWITHAGQDYR